MLDTVTFHKLADVLLEHITNLFETITNDVDIDWQGSQLIIELKPGKSYLFNKHEYSRQIWLASPFSGAHHFYYNATQQAWLDTRTEQNCVEFIANEIRQNVP